MQQRACGFLGVFCAVMPMTSDNDVAEVLQLNWFSYMKPALVTSFISDTAVIFMRQLELPLILSIS